MTLMFINADLIGIIIYNNIEDADIINISMINTANYNVPIARNTRAYIQSTIQRKHKKISPKEQRGGRRPLF